jgi:hypothetical protein
MIHAACLPNDQQQQHHHYHQSSHHLHHTGVITSIAEGGALIGRLRRQPSLPFKATSRRWLVSDPICVLTCCARDLSTPNFLANNNDDSESNSKNDDAITDKTDKPVAPSKMKMPVDRCVALMLSAIERNRNRQQKSQSLLPLLLQPLPFQEA